MDDLKGQLTVRGVVIGCVGCVVITAASLYTALKMGALPWPIIFAALVALFGLRLFGSRSLNEANVTHTIMSAGSMVAGGLAFTLPGIWILGLGEVSFVQMLLVALAGVLLGLVGCALFRRQFVEEQQLEFPIGRAAAETLKAGDAGGRTGVQLFGAMGLAGVWAALRDTLGAVPTMLLGELAVPGIAFGVYLSPMMVAVGFLVGAGAMLAWFGGAMGQVALVAGGSALGLYDVEFGQALNSSLGMGLMMGGGVAVVVKDVLPKIARFVAGRAAGATDMAGACAAGASSGAAGVAGANASTVEGEKGVAGGHGHVASAGEGVQSSSAAPDGVAMLVRTGAGRAGARAGAFGLGAALLALAMSLILGIGPIASAIVVALSFVTVAMSAQSVGQTGIDPMEIFGLIVLLIVALIGDTPQLALFFVAGIIAVACGMGGDVMNDFKAGHALGTSSTAQLIGQAIGGVLGAFVAAGALYALVAAYGPDAFGVGNQFVAAQANVVATLVGGIPNVAAFLAGLVGGFAIYLLGGPAMMIGLGVYLPFYLSLTAFLGCVAKWVFDTVVNRRRSALPPDAQADAAKRSSQAGLVVASGLLGGESVVGVLTALTAVFM